ncbi:hypothetical protein LJR231_002251 [Phyllobacterium sp. LjRoot231]|uniref:hypothetical protein n=1 Tax=Phyllobacterium sp. LjRoot231 TaxID=3342289 RepID=UPI003ECDBB57
MITQSELLAGGVYRGAYRPDVSADLARLEKKRLALGISLSVLAARSAINIKTLYRMRVSGRGFYRHIRSITFALRSIEKERKAVLEMFPMHVTLPAIEDMDPDQLARPTKKAREVTRAASLALRGIQAAVNVSILPEADRKSAALYLLVTGGNVPGAIAASIAGCTKQNISKLLRSVEERRGNSGFDRELSTLEQQLFGEAL